MARPTTRTIRQTVLIPAPPAAVYRALMDARTHAAFTGAAAKGAARVGARFSAWDGYVAARHLVLAKGRRIVQEWSTSEWPPGAPESRLVLTLRKTKAGTRLTMVHSNVPASQAARYRKGWIDHYWKPLRAFFERP